MRGGHADKIHGWVERVILTAIGDFNFKSSSMDDVGNYFPVTYSKSRNINHLRKLHPLLSFSYLFNSILQLKYINKSK